MKTTTMTAICGAVIATAIAIPGIHAAPEAAARQASPGDAVQTLEARYSARLEALAAEISKAIPQFH